MGTGHRSPTRWRRAAIGVAAAAALNAALVAGSAVADVDPRGAPSAGRPFGPVLERVVDGDLLLIGNSNLLSAGGWRGAPAADVDGDDTAMCVERPGATLPSERRLCADNSSSADLDLPDGAQVIAARLYVETSLGRHVGPVAAALEGPGSASRPLASAPSITTSPAKLYEAVAGAGPGGVLRHAVWDVTDYVATAGGGTYTVADIVSQRAGPFLPYASWAMVVAYELDPAVGLDGIAAADRQRFSTRVVSWHDGFQLLDGGSVDVAVDNVAIRPGTLPFGKSLHVVAGGQAGQSDNLLFAGEPLGNSNSPGDAPPPEDVTIGSDPACNAVTDVQNDSICVLGTNVTTKSPGATGFLSSADGRTPASGSGVDIDVIRIPDRHLRAAGSRPILQVQSTGADAVAPAVLAVSIDVPREVP